MIDIHQTETTEGTEQDSVHEKLRSQILSQPDLILEDRKIMRALVDASDDTNGPNVVDLRGVAVNRLERRLSRLEDSYKAVIAAAYENRASTEQVHRAILIALQADGLDSFLALIEDEFRDVLNVVAVRLCFETADSSQDIPGIVFLEQGGVNSYATGDPGVLLRKVTLRQSLPESRKVYGDLSGKIKSEAVIRLDLGQRFLPAMIVFGSADLGRFTPWLKPDLLRFLGKVLERQIVGWLNS